MACALAVAPLGAVACGNDDSAGGEQGADVEDIAENDYFGDEQYVGQTVTVSANVTNVLNQRSFVLSGEDYGDDSLLVVARKARKNVQEGDVVQVTGKVRQFRYDQYNQDFALGEADLYSPYDSEEFLVANRINPDPGTTGTTGTGNSGG
ncbi:hypothetical protein [Prauserella muralis]|uniref:Uncharacterized protein n=1 Tax=Prauserella muralis TaxID=588067 RepID=A0A2V4ASZ0_9PSEU|nr:hypothetical protein [Prauserella muralis]PXY22661.1 hypothetical protein BAY60_22850 [Prauserella muralis]TWE28371.1 hypothetical protein FHX69_1026 [Prauserella muralis]